MSLLKKIQVAQGHYSNAIERKKLEHQIRFILREQKQLETLSNRDLKRSTEVFKHDLSKGQPLKSIMGHSFAVVAEVSRRVLGRLPTEEEILIAILLFDGTFVDVPQSESCNIAFAQMMPAYTKALHGKGTHIVSASAQAVESNVKTYSAVYNFLGCTVGLVTSDFEPEDKRRSYRADVAYITGKELALDFLRDKASLNPLSRIMPAHGQLHAVLVEGIQSFVGDELLYPIILTVPNSATTSIYKDCMKIAAHMNEGVDYLVSYKLGLVEITSLGLIHAEKLFGEKIFLKTHSLHLEHIKVCLKALVLYELGRDYVMQENGIKLLNEFSGNPDDAIIDHLLHLALEIKEGIIRKNPDTVLGMVTYPDLFNSYQSFSATGSNLDQIHEKLEHIFNHEIVFIPAGNSVKNSRHHRPLRHWGEKEISHVNIRKLVRSAHAQVFNRQKELFWLRDTACGDIENFKVFFQKSVAVEIARIFQLHGHMRIARELRDVFHIEVGDDELNRVLASDLLRRQAQERLVSFLEKLAHVFEEDSEVGQAAQVLVWEVIQNSWSEYVKLFNVLQHEALVVRRVGYGSRRGLGSESNRLYDSIKEKMNRHYLQALFQYLSCVDKI